MDVSMNFRFSIFPRSRVVLCWNSSRRGKRQLKSASMIPGLVALVALTFIFVRDTTGFVVVLTKGCALTTSKDDSSTGLLQIQRVRHSGLMRRRFLAAHNKDVPSTTQTSPTINEEKHQTSSMGGPEKTANVTTSPFEELLRKCTEATSSDGATESPHTGSSEWAGFRTKPHLLEHRGNTEQTLSAAIQRKEKLQRSIDELQKQEHVEPTAVEASHLCEGVTRALERARQRSRDFDGSAMVWSWLTLSPRPVRVTLASENPRFGVYLTVLPAGKGSPPSHCPMYGCHMLSRVLAGEIEQVKSNSQRVTGRSTHSLETPVWSSYGGGARRLFNEGFQPAIILEVILYDWSRGSGYSGSYTAPGTSSSGSAERRAEADEIGVAVGSDGGGERENAVGRIVPIVTMDVCPCPPAILFRDGDIYEEEEDEESGDGMRLALIRRDGKAVGAVPGAVGERSGPVSGGIGFSDLFTADDLACDVGGLDNQLDDIVRRVLSTRSIPAELRQALGVSHVRGLLLHGPPGCGKTLLARELSRRLGARPPKLVSGPEILDKWVGEAERKVRLLFLDAELEHQRCLQMGEDPAGLPLNLVCFDEIDALCRRRGSLSGDTSGVRDSVVNQILSKMDGLVNLQNVLVVGMTNRKELLDEALLRPGRFEVCMPIPLPDKRGREQILAIHLRKARDTGLVSSDVDDKSLSQQTQGFSGADLAGLVRSAISFAIADWRRRVDEGYVYDGEDKGLTKPPDGKASRITFGVQNDGNISTGNDDRKTVAEGSDGEEETAAGNELIVTGKHFEKAFLEVGSGRMQKFGARGRIVKWGSAFSGSIRGALSRDPRV